MLALREPREGFMEERGFKRRSDLKSKEGEGEALGWTNVTARWSDYKDSRRRLWEKVKW